MLAQHVSNNAATNKTRIPSWLPRGGSAVAIGVTTFVALSAVLYSHDSQIRDKQNMRAGVERDKERLRQRKKQQSR